MLLLAAQPHSEKVQTETKFLPAVLKNESQAIRIENMDDVSLQQETSISQSKEMTVWVWEQPRHLFTWDGSSTVQYSEAG